MRFRRRSKHEKGESAMHMTWSRRLSSLVLIALFTGSTAAFGSPRGRVYVRVGPPPSIVDVRSRPPSVRHLWVAGSHRWDGHGYIWVSGRWISPPYPQAMWVPAHWVRDGRGLYVVEGHWRR